MLAFGGWCGVSEKRAALGVFGGLHAEGGRSGGAKRPVDAERIAA